MDTSVTQTATTLNSPSKNEDQRYNSNTCTYFLIDGSKKMFEKNPNADEEEDPGNNYFKESLEKYSQVVRHDCMWSNKNSMGLLIYNVEEDNQDPVLKNCLIHNELDQVNMEMACNIKKTIDKRITYYESIASEQHCSLLEALKHAEGKLMEAKKTFLAKIIVVITADDNPLADDEDKRHEIRKIVKRMSTIYLDLKVICLKKDYNENLFWKDLEMLFQNDWSVYKRNQWDELVMNLKKPPRTYRKVILRLFDALSIPVGLALCSQKRRYIKATYVDKTSNLPIRRHTSYVPKGGLVDDDVEILDEDVEADLGDKKYSGKFGGRTVLLEPREKSHIFTPNVDLQIVGFKPQTVYPEFHFKAPYFVTLTNKYTKDQKNQFIALIKRCTAKNIMAVCHMSLSSKPKMFTLVPSLNKGGFYLIAAPFKNQVRSLKHVKNAKDYYFASNDVKFPVNRECVEMWKKMMWKIRMIKEFIASFNNPKLGRQMAQIEANALELSDVTAPEDNTQPMEDMIRKKLEKGDNILGQYKQLYPQNYHTFRAKKRKATVFDDDFTLDGLKSIVQNNKLDKCTVAELKDFCVMLKVSTIGRKNDLMTRIIKYL